jgi:hypothetical protein
MGQFFEIQRTRHAQSVTDDSITIDVPAGRKLKVHGVSVVGGDSAGAASAEIGVYRVTTNGSGGTPSNAVLKPLDPAVSAPSGFTAKFGYTTQPVAEADPVIRVPFQPFGGQGAWPPVAGAPAEFWLVTAYQVSVRGINASGTDAPNVSVSLTVELE